MNKKILLIVIFIILILVLAIGINYWMKIKNNLPTENTNIVSGETSGKYITEEIKEKYSMRILESENKEYATLYIETNIIESGEKVSIDYNNEKFLLNTANPLLENIEIKRNNNISTINIEIEKLQNYSITFIKKDVKSKIEKADIKVY